MEHVLTIDPSPRRAVLFDAIDPAVAYAILERELLARIQAKISGEQCGEAFEGLDTVCRSS